MPLLLDTHLFLWSSLGSAKLKHHARALIEGASAVFVSSASIWELAIKSGVGKLEVDAAALAAGIEPAGFIELPVTAKHAARVSGLPAVHGDPFDRLLIAQALCESLTLLTADTRLAEYGPAVQVL